AMLRETHMRRFIRLHHACRKLPANGMTLVVKGKRQPNRLSPAVVLNRASNIRLENINIFHAGGMGLIAERSEDITLHKFNVCLRPGTKRLVSTTADATHFVSCRGSLRFEQCLFENMLDDATNVHGIYTRVVKPTGPNRLLARIVHFQQHGFDFADPGDDIRFSCSQTLLPQGRARVKTVRPINEEIFEITFYEPIDRYLNSETILDNLSWQPDVFMHDCTVRNNRARSILLTTAGDVLISENRFERSSMSNILIEGDAYFWHESGPVRRIRIERNRFIDLNPTSPSIKIAARRSDPGENPECYHRNIVIADNIFELHGTEILQALGTQGLTFRNNRIQKAKDYRSGDPNAPAICIEGCRDVTIAGNTCALERTGHLVIDEQSKGWVTVNNTGLEP
ncbi:right-handed parallel beta-helix repeat-containing protein, partial [Planctomycetota bacterium]